MDTPDLSRILADLAAGRIDAAEAGRRIEELQGGAPAASGSPTEETTGPSTAPGTGTENGTAGPGPSSSETWAPTAGAAQVAGDVLRDVFRTARHAAARAADVAAEAAGAAGYGRAPAGPAPAPGTTTGTAGGRPGALQRVSVRTTGKRVRIVVDPSVSTCHVTGEHVLRRNGDVFEVSAEGDFRPHLGGLKLLPDPLHLEGLRRMGRGNELLIRMNPALALDVEVTGGQLQVSNVPRLGRVRLTAGGATISGFEVVEDALVQMAVVQMAGRITTGRSRIRVESGQLSLKLADESNVTVVADSRLGRITWTGRHSGAGDQVVMGNGAARLDIGVVVGHAGVQVGDPATPTEG